MNIMNSFALRHLKLNRHRTVITIIGIILSMVMITAISGFVASLQDAVYRTAIEISGNWHVAYRNVTPEQIENISAIPDFSESYIETDEQGNASIYLKMKKVSSGIYERTETIANEQGIQADSISYNGELLLAEGVSENTNEVDAMRNLAIILIAVIMLSSIIVISNAFYVSASERSKQFAILKSVGATKAQIRKSILFEALFLSSIAIPIGILLGIMVEWIAIGIINNVLVDMWDGADFILIISFATILLSVGITLITVIIAAWFPARRISKVSTVEAIRQVQDVKIKPQKVKMSALTQRLFGIEGTLAVKSYKRNKSKYRAAVISLVISIVLFIGLSSIESLLKEAVNMAFVDYGKNVIVKIFSISDYEKQVRLIGGLSQLNPLEENQILRAESLTDISPQKLVGEAKDIVNSEVFGVKLISVGQEEFNKLMKAQGLSPEEFSDTENPKGILVNSSGVVQRDGKRIMFAPFLLDIGDTVPMIAYDKQPIGHITVGGITEEIPVSIAPDYNGRTTNFIVSEAVLKDLIETGKFRHQLVSMYKVENAESFCLKANVILKNELSESAFFIMNTEQETKTAQNIHFLVMVFSYGFIFMLSAIGVTSVITTIYTTMELRKREFAMLRSVGMTEKAMSKMLNTESFLYGLKALIIGVILGTALSYLFYKAIGAGFELGYMWPWQSVVISCIVTMLLILLTTTFTKSKQKNSNIIDVLRQDNI